MDPSLRGRPVSAPTKQKSTGIMTKKTFVIILLVVGALAAGGLMLAAGRDNSGQMQQRLTLRQANLVALVANGSENISAEPLRDLNSELAIVLDSDVAAYNAATAVKKPKKPSKDLLASETIASVTENLASAKLEGKYDREYRDALIEQITFTNQLVSDLYEETKSKKLKPVLETEYEHLAKFSERLEALKLP